MRKLWSFNYFGLNLFFQYCKNVSLEAWFRDLATNLIQLYVETTTICNEIRLAI